MPIFWYMSCGYIWLIIFFFHFSFLFLGTLLFIHRPAKLLHAHDPGNNYFFNGADLTLQD